MTAKDVESDLNPCRAIAAFSVPTGQFNAHRCKAVELVVRAENVRFGSSADIVPCPLQVRFTPKADKLRERSDCPLSTRSPPAGGFGVTPPQWRGNADQDDYH